MVSKADNQMQDGLKNRCVDISSDAVRHGFLACRLQVAGSGPRLHRRRQDNAPYCNFLLVARDMEQSIYVSHEDYDLPDINRILLLG